MAATDADIDEAAAGAVLRRKNDILVRRTLFFTAAALYFLFGIAQPVRVQCGRVQYGRVDCFLLERWLGSFSGRWENFTDVRRARISEQDMFERGPLTGKYFFYMDTGAIMRPASSVKWMDRQNAAELEAVTDEINAWIANPKSSPFMRTVRLDFINGLLLVFCAIGVVAIAERWIKRRNSKQPLQLS